MLGGLLRLLAHDLRSPLTALQSNLDFVSREGGQIGEDGREALIDSLLSCDAFAHLTENCDLLALALSDKAAPQLGPVGVRELLEDVTRRSAAVATSYGQSITVDVQGQAVVKSEAEMLGRCIGNLVRNSVQHSPGHSSLLISAHEAEGTVQLWVQDQGPKVPDELRQAMFTAEGQLSTQLHRGRYSRGLGLFCAHVAAELCGAQLAVLDRAEAANTFAVTLAQWV